MLTAALTPSTMLIAYFDEVKYFPGSQPYQWLAGLVVNASIIRELEDQVSSLAQECFGISTLCKQSEFHASAIFHRKENFKEWSEPAKRMDVLKRLLKIIDRHEAVSKVFVQLEPARMINPADLDEKTFMFFVERVDLHARKLQDDCLLIGDYEKDSVATIAAQNLSTFRADGTSFRFGRDIQRIIDTVHFSASHLSRMLQLADLYAWTLQFCQADNSASPHRLELESFIRRETKILNPHRYKIWPTESSWLNRTPA